MATMKQVLEEQKMRVRVSFEEVQQLEKIAGRVIEALRKKGMTARVGGSLAKGTLVAKKGVQDVDIFVVFDTEQETKKLGRVLEGMSSFGKLRTVHGSRDYYQLLSKEAVLELVPVVSHPRARQAENVTDFSLSHVAYVRDAVEKDEELADEIRLAKSFCVAQGVYGAESYIHGFSGYALEVLVIHFGSFVKFLRGILKARIVDPAKHFATAKVALREINGSKLVSPVILVDPTYKHRNALAGLRKETFEKFVVAAKAFLKRPTRDFFKKQELDVNTLEALAQKKNGRLLKILLTTNRQEGDIAGTKMKKYFDFFIKELGRMGQNVLRTEFEYTGKGQTATGYIVVIETKEITIKGPSKKLATDVIERFKKAKGVGAYEKRGNWWYTQKTSITKIFAQTKKVEEEMGAKGELV